MEWLTSPEIWIAFAQRTGIQAFNRTTRDEPDYDKLMRYRLALLRQHGLRLSSFTPPRAWNGCSAAWRISHPA